MFFLPVKNQAKLGNDIQFFLEAGVHSEIVLSTALSTAAGQNRDGLAKEFGWYVVCNDRIILAADSSSLTGWMAKWHNEYNGFVGMAFFVSEDPSKLPWDSKKTGIDRLSASYLGALPMMRETAELFRKKNRARLKKIAELKKEREAKIAKTLADKYLNLDKSGDTTGSTKDKGNSDSVAKPPHNNLPHNSELATLLPPNCVCVVNSLKMASMVKEGAGTVIAEYPHRAAIFLRCLFEHILLSYLMRHGHYLTIKKEIHDRLPVEKKLTNPVNKIQPTISDILEWAKLNPSIWPSADEKTCKQGCAHYTTHLKRLNGVVHDITGPISEHQVTTIRNDVIDTLLVLLAN